MAKVVGSVLSQYIYQYLLGASNRQRSKTHPNLLCFGITWNKTSSGVDETVRDSIYPQLPAVRRARPVYFQVVEASEAKELIARTIEEDNIELTNHYYVVVGFVKF